jgi:hypothetical protein
MKRLRNTPGTGQHSRVQIATSGVPQRFRTSIASHRTSIVRIIAECYGRDTLQQAWREFTLGLDKEFAGDDPHCELFFSWLFHRWSPKRSRGVSLCDRTLYGVPPSRAFLERNPVGIDPAVRKYFEACLATPLCFYEVSACKPRRGFNARDLLTGAQFVVNDSLASTSLKNGHIFFAHMPCVDGTACLEAISPYSFPPTFRARVTRWRARAHGNVAGHADRSSRNLYFSLLEALASSLMPEVRNTEGDILEQRILQFDIECPQSTFDALVSLAGDVTRDDLLNTARFDRHGRLQEALIPWVKPASSRGAKLEHALWGLIRIHERKLLLEVNSAERAAAFRALIAHTPNVKANYRRMRVRPLKRKLQFHKARSYLKWGGGSILTEPPPLARGPQNPHRGFWIRR